MQGFQPQDGAQTTWGEPINYGSCGKTSKPETQSDNTAISGNAVVLNWITLKPPQLQPDYEKFDKKTNLLFNKQKL